jgi:aldose 1-epimerase
MLRYWNLSDGPTIEGSDVTLFTTKYLAVSDKLIPTGAVEDFPGLEAGKTFELGAVDPDIDHCFVVDTDTSDLPLDTRKRELKPLISISHPKTKLHLDISSTEPAFQFYTGKHIKTDAYGDVPARGARAGFCVEASRFIDAINQDKWKNQVILKKGGVWGSKTVHKAWKP